MDIIAECGLLGSKPFPTRLEKITTSHSLTVRCSLIQISTDAWWGHLIYLTNTRPKLCYSIHVLSQFMQAPKEAHWEAAIRVVRFIKGDPGQGIMLKAENISLFWSYVILTGHLAS